MASNDPESHLLIEITSSTDESDDDEQDFKLPPVNSVPSQPSDRNNYLLMPPQPQVTAESHAMETAMASLYAASVRTSLSRMSMPRSTQDPFSSLNARGFNVASLSALETPTTSVASLATAQNSLQYPTLEAAHTLLLSHTTPVPFESTPLLEPPPPPLPRRRLLGRRYAASLLGNHVHNDHYLPRLQAPPHVAPHEAPASTTTVREVNANDETVHALSTHLGAYQRQLLAHGSVAEHPIRGLEAVTASQGSSVIKLASSQWTEELMAKIDPVSAFHVGRFMTDDPDPSVSLLVQQMAQQMLSSKIDEEKMASINTRFVDLANDTARGSLQEEIDCSVAEVANSLDIPPDAALLLLHDFNFNVDLAIQSVRTDRQGTMGRLGLSLRCSKKRKMPDTHGSLRSCGICYDDFGDGAPMFRLACHHDFCLDCWRGHIQSKVHEGWIRILTLTCPSPNCTERLTIDDTLKISPELIHTWQKAYLHSFVERSLGTRRFCPGKGCTMVAVAPRHYHGTKKLLEATCTSCKTCFCMQCGDTPHFPAKCVDLSAFHCMFGSSTFWIKKNTKPCPGCNSAVEKIGGCNAMACTRCHARFCWLCLSKVDGHRQHTCTKFEPELNAEENQFEFYGKRFQAHKTTEINARDQLKYWEDVPTYLMGETQSMLQSQDIATLRKALETLVDARNFLKNACIASCARTTNLTFETHLAALESSTEALNRLTEVYVEQLNDEGGERLIRKHFGMLGLHTLFVVHCLKRMIALADVD